MSDSDTFEEFIARDESESKDFRPRESALPLGDRRDGLYYYYTREIKLAVRVALAVGRPLLLLGPSGCGKSSLVFNLARQMGRRYYEFVVQARTQAQDLFYRFDAIRRLGEAQLKIGDSERDAGDWRSCYPFIEPQALWWVLDPDSALRRGAPENREIKFSQPLDPGRWPDDYVEPKRRTSLGGTIPPAVLLIDEIDKADPDFANNLLVPIGSQQFTIEETGDVITPKGGADSLKSPPLIVITSNSERELPEAFIRRCIGFEIKRPTREELVRMAQGIFPQLKERTGEYYLSIANKLVDVRGESRLSTAEFLDVVRAIESLKADPVKWEEIILRATWRTMGDSASGNPP